jgi:hypothetical protein
VPCRGRPGRGVPGEVCRGGAGGAGRGVSGRGGAGPAGRGCRGEVCRRGAGVSGRRAAPARSRPAGRPSPLGPCDPLDRFCGSRGPAARPGPVNRGRAAGRVGVRPGRLAQLLSRQHRRDATRTEPAARVGIDYPAETGSAGRSWRRVVLPGEHGCGCEEHRHRELARGREIGGGLARRVRRAPGAGARTRGTRAPGHAWRPVGHGGLTLILPAPQPPPLSFWRRSRQRLGARPGEFRAPG